MNDLIATQQIDIADLDAEIAAWVAKTSLLNGSTPTPSVDDGLTQEIEIIP